MNLASSLFERIADFLEEHPPFQYVNKTDLLDLAKASRIEFHEAEEIIFEEGKPRKKFFYIVNKGSVRVSSESKGTRELTDIRQVGDILGTGHLMEPEGDYVNTAISQEDTILYTIPWNLFAELLPIYPDVVRYMKANISLRSNIHIPSLADTVEMFPSNNLSETLVGRIEETTQLSEYAKTRFVYSRPDDTMQEAAFKMISTKSEAIVVIDPESRPLGIVTKTDMAKTVQSGRSPREAPVREFMSSPVITVESNPRLGKCLRIMMKSGFQHLCLTEDGTPETPAIGVISERDLMLYYGNNPMVIIRQIGEVNNFEELSHMRHRADMLILHELRNADSLGWFSEVVHDLNRAFIKKVVRLAIDALRLKGIYMPPSSFCLFFAGMGGRKELFTRSAMDRGLIYQADDEKDETYCKSFYQKLSNRIHEGLLKCGWTKNLLGYTEKNPYWCQPLNVWKQYFTDWITDETNEELSANLHWFDMLPADGFEDLVHELSAEIKHYVESSSGFVRRFAKVTIEKTPPAEVFDQFLKREEGMKPPLFDLQENVIIPLVLMARMLVYAHGILDKTSTYDRFMELATKDSERKNLYEEAGEGFRIALLIVARTGLRDQNRGNLIDPTELNSLEIQLVKSTFRTVLNLQNLIESQYLQS